MSDAHSNMTTGDLVAFLREAEVFAQFSDLPGSVKKAVKLAIERLATGNEAAPVAAENMRAATRDMIANNPEGARLEMAAMAAEIRELKAKAAPVAVGDATCERCRGTGYHYEWCVWRDWPRDRHAEKGESA